VIARIIRQVTGAAPKFDLGRVLITPAAQRFLDSTDTTPLNLLVRHGTGDWGDICTEDRGLNEQSLVEGSRLLSVYKVLEGADAGSARDRVPVWVITEATDDDGKRAATTILLPEDY
jgi:hypothetical protein